MASERAFELLCMGRAAVDLYGEQVGAPIDRVCPEVYVGQALVWDVTGCDPITVAELRLAPLDQAPRLLLRTGAWIDHSQFPDTVPVLAPVPAVPVGVGGVVL